MIGDLRKKGMSYREITDRLGICKSTVAYHARRLGVEADYRFATRYDWNEIQAAYDSGLRMRECQARFGFSGAAWSQAIVRGDIKPRPRATPLANLLVSGRGRSCRGYLKRRLLAAGIKDERCEQCGLSDWQGQTLALHLHHINGDGSDNRLENLAMLCPNCHSQTETFGGRNIGRVSPPT
jgi:5-methylcytosine-specific restriction endonuclease McrA